MQQAARCWRVFTFMASGPGLPRRRPPPPKLSSVRSCIVRLILSVSVAFSAPPLPHTKSRWRPQALLCTVGRGLLRACAVRGIQPCLHPSVRPRVRSYSPARGGRAAARSRPPTPAPTPRPPPPPGPSSRAGRNGSGAWSGGGRARVYVRVREAGSAEQALDGFAEGGGEAVRRLLRFRDLKISIIK